MWVDLKDGTCRERAAAACVEDEDLSLIWGVRCSDGHADYVSYDSEELRHSPSKLDHEENQQSKQQPDTWCAAKRELAVSWMSLSIRNFPSGVSTSFLIWLE